LDAKGYSNGLWTVAFPVNNGGFNNLEMCNSNRGCGLVNSVVDDQFLGGTSVSADAAYWVSYYTYSTLNSRSIPLLKQSIYFPAAGSAIGATTHADINPTYWVHDPPPSTRCGSIACFEAGDFHAIGSNPFGAASTPFVRQDTGNPFTDLAQDFVSDPPDPNGPGIFTPNFIPFPLGADITELAVPVPLPAGYDGINGRITKRSPLSPPH